MSAQGLVMCDIAHIIAALVENPVAFAAVCVNRAEAVARLGRAIQHEADLWTRHPAGPSPSGLQGDSYARVVYYMATGWVAPNPGNFVYKNETKAPVWPFRVPEEWLAVLECTPAKTDRVYHRNADGTLGHRNGHYHDPHTNIAERDRPFFERQIKAASPFARSKQFLGVGPVVVALIYDQRVLQTTLATADPLGNLLCHDVGPRWFGLLSMRRVSPTCLALMDEHWYPGRYQVLFCTAVVWWTQARGLRVRAFESPAHADWTGGWALPPLDADQNGAPVFVLDLFHRTPIDITAARQGRHANA